MLTIEFLQTLKHNLDHDFSMERGRAFIFNIWISSHEDFYVIAYFYLVTLTS